MKLNTKTLTNAKVVEWLQGHTNNRVQLSANEYEVTVYDVPIVIVHYPVHHAYTFKGKYTLLNLSERVASDLEVNYIDVNAITHWMWRACGHYDLVDGEFLELRELLDTGLRNSDSELLSKAGAYADRVPLPLLRQLAKRMFSSEGVLHVVGVSGGYTYVTASYLYKKNYFNVANVKAVTNVVDTGPDEKLVTIRDNSVCDDTVVAYVMGYDVADNEVYLEYAFEKALFKRIPGEMSTLTVVCFILAICDKRYPSYGEYVEYVHKLSDFLMMDNNYDPVMGNYDEVDLLTADSPYKVISDENYICESAVREAINVTRGLSHLPDNME